MTSDIRERFTEDGGQQKIRQILLGNRLVSAEENLAAVVADRGSLVVFEQGETLIEEGSSDDHVYFLLAGEVRISIVGKTTTLNRIAPIQIGEMSALNPTDKRSATVTAVSGQVAAIKLDASEFQGICREYPSFHQRALIDQNDRNKAWKRQDTEATWAHGLLTARAAAAVSAVVTALLLSVFIGAQFSIMVALIAFFVLVTAVLLAMLWFNRTTMLYSCFASSAFTTLYFLTNPVSFSFFFSGSWYSGRLESSSEPNAVVVFGLFAVSAMFLGAAIYSQRTGH